MEDAVLVPSDALYFEDGDAYVFLLRDGTAVRVPVTIGLYTTDTIAITQGLTPGDQVITSWSASLKDGAPVRVAGESSGETDTGTDSGAEEQ